MARFSFDLQTLRLLRLALAATALVAFGATADARSDHKKHHRSHHNVHHKVQHRSTHLADLWTGCRSGDPDKRIAACGDHRPRRQGDEAQSRRRHVNRGGAYHAKGDYDRAIADYDMALQIDRRAVGRRARRPRRRLSRQGRLRPRHRRL